MRQGRGEMVFKRKICMPSGDLPVIVAVPEDLESMFCLRFQLCN